MVTRLYIPFGYEHKKDQIKKAKKEGNKEHAKWLEDRLASEKKRIKNLPLETALAEIEKQVPIWKVRHGWGRMTDKYDMSCDDDYCEEGCRLETKLTVNKFTYRFVLGRPDYMNVYSSDMMLFGDDNYLLTYAGQKVRELYFKERDKLM